MPLELETNQEPTVKLYSQRAISIATYLGGPLAAGILVRRNFLNLGNENHGLFSVIIGIASTLLLLIGLYYIPEHILDKIPNAVIPLVYTAIIALVIDKVQGEDLKTHKESNGVFYSAWKATGIGAAWAVVFVGLVFGAAYLETSNFDAIKYDSGIDKFNKNEEKALVLFSLLETDGPGKIISHIDIEGIPAWRQNIIILDELDKISGLPDEFKVQNGKLRKYAELRIESFGLIKKAVSEGSSDYDNQIQNLHTQIDDVIGSL